MKVKAQTYLINTRVKDNLRKDDAKKIKTSQAARTHKKIEYYYVF